MGLLYNSSPFDRDHCPATSIINWFSILPNFTCMFHTYRCLKFFPDNCWTFKTSHPVGSIIACNCLEPIWTIFLNDLGLGALLYFTFAQTILVEYHLNLLRTINLSKEGPYLKVLNFRST